MMAKTKSVKNEDVTVAEALTEILSVNTAEHGVLSVQLTVATNALDQFAIKAKVHPAAPLETLFDSAGDFTSPGGLLKITSGDLTTQAAATTGSFVMDISGYYQVRLYAASGNVAGSVVDVYAGLQ
jgi:hypothetical protein